MADLPDKSTHWMDWYLEVVEQAGLTDKRYGVKGLNVWPPYGLLARRQLDRVMVEEIEATGSQPVEFPALIPQTEFQKEKDHIKGFDAQVYWVTKGGESVLDIPLVLRPTSETAMYPMFATWVRSHRDLPLNVYQVVNVFRYETKTTRPFLRIREVHFFEEHTCQVDEAAANARVQSNLRAFARMAEAYALSYVPVRRPDWDKFPGAFYSIALDLPIGDGRTLQIGSIHHYRENFSRPFGIDYEAPDGSRKFVHQTTFGLSERLLGAIVTVHGDQKGVVLPPAVAPYQVVIVPIVSTSDGGAVNRHAEAVADRLTRAELRVHIDRREDRPGAKYYHWELRGVPLRLELGKREAADGSVTLVDRLGQKQSISGPELENGVRGALAALDKGLTERAQTAFRDAFRQVSDLSELKELRRVAQLGWCGDEECGRRIETEIDGALLGTPEGAPPIPGEAPSSCLVCGKTPAVWALAGRPI